jgi:hypothetical protein
MAEDHVWKDDGQGARAAKVWERAAFAKRSRLQLDLTLPVRMYANAFAGYVAVRADSSSDCLTLAARNVHMRCADRGIFLLSLSVGPTLKTHIPGIPVASTIVTNSDIHKNTPWLIKMPETAPSVVQEHLGTHSKSSKTTTGGELSKRVRLLDLVYIRPLDRSRTSIARCKHLDQIRSYRRCKSPERMSLVDLDTYGRWPGPGQAWYLESP